MKAIVQDTYGSADVLRLQDIEAPVPGAGEVLVRVHAAGVDPGVWHLMTGTPYLIRVFGFGFRAPKVRVRGMDVAGRVEGVGEGVTRLEVGDAVFGTCDGSFAEYAVAKEEKLAPRPANLTFAQAAAVPISGCTALQGVRDHARVQVGQKVLVVGASGGVGSFAVQIAKALGAEVTGVCSTQKVEFVRSLGADHVVDYTREDFTQSDRRYVALLDIAGNRPLSRLRRVLTPRGTLVIVGGENAGPWTGGLHRQLGCLVLSPFVGHALRTYVASEAREDLLHLTELIEAGKLTPAIGATYALEQAADAVRAIETKHARGKLVLAVHDADS